MKTLTLKREICDTLAIAATVGIASLIGKAIPIRVILTFCFVMAIIEIMVTCYRKDRECYPTKASMFYMLPMVLVLLIATALVVMKPLSGKHYVLVLAMAMASDAGGLIFGRFFGRSHPIFSKHISPNKTWAGYFGSLVCTWSVGLLGAIILQLEVTKELIILIGLSFVIASAGDLLGSGAKRELGIKHSSDYTLDIPVLRQLEVLMRSRHGYLDCLDSVSLLVIFAMLLLG